MPEITPIPSDVNDVARLRELINERFRRINASGGLLLVGDLDAGGHRITNLGNPKDLTDAVNDATLRARSKRGAGTAAGTNTTTQRVITETRVSGGGSVAASVFIRRPAQLTASPTNITEAEVPTDDKILIVVIQQGAAAAHTITFDPANFSSTPTNISPELGKYNYWMFCGNSGTGKWDLVTHPMLERTL